MDQENVMQANVKQDMFSKQVKQLAHFASISVLSAVQMILEHASNVEELDTKTLMVYVRVALRDASNAQVLQSAPTVSQVSSFPTRSVLRDLRGLVWKVQLVPVPNV
jgi:hypothetical protein